MNMTAAMEARTNKPLTAYTDQEIYLALLDIVREQSAARVRPVTGRKLYYISAEFLIGKLLSNNLINLGLYDDTRAVLAVRATLARPGSISLWKMTSCVCSAATASRT